MWAVHVDEQCWVEVATGTGVGVAGLRIPGAQAILAMGSARELAGLLGSIARVDTTVLFLCEHCVELARPLGPWALPVIEIDKRPKGSSRQGFIGVCA